jgi:hypothetical protein
MEDDNIIPYETSPTLTVKQAVMYILGYRGQYSFVADTELMEFDLFDYLHDLQEEADCAFSNASSELKVLKRTDSPSPEAINIAEGKIKSTKVELEKAQKLSKLAEQYRLLINHEISRVRLGKRSPLVIDEDESARTSQLRINTARFQEWLEGMELDDATEASAPVALPVDEDAFDRELSRKSAESLYVTLGLLVSLFAESSGNKLGSGQNPTVSSIVKELDEYLKQLNGGHKLHGQGKDSITGRIEVALSALRSNV